MIKFELVKPEGARSTLPDDIKPRATGDAICYKITDRIHALPAGLWDSDVVSASEFTNLDTGVFVRLKSPLAILMETVWEIKGEEKLEMVESVRISCSRLLIGTVKGQCEANWRAIHGTLIAKLTGES
jgi:hypothetical protein